MRSLSCFELVYFGLKFMAFKQMVVMLGDHHGNVCGGTLSLGCRVLHYFLPLHSCHAVCGGVFVLAINIVKYNEKLVTW